MQPSCACCRPWLYSSASKPAAAACKTGSHLHIILHAVKKLLHARQLLQLLCRPEERLHCTSVLQLSLPRHDQRLDLLDVWHTLEDSGVIRGCSVMALQGTGAVLLRSESGRMPVRREDDCPLRCRSSSCQTAFRGSSRRPQWRGGGHRLQRRSSGRWSGGFCLTHDRSPDWRLAQAATSALLLLLGGLGRLLPRKAV